MRFLVAFIAACVLASDAAAETTVEPRNVIPGERLRVERLDGIIVTGKVTRCSPYSIEILDESSRLVVVPNDEILRAVRLDEGIPTLGCCLTSPRWSFDPRRPVLWVDGGYGPGATLRDDGGVGGISVSYGVGEAGLVRITWTQFVGSRDEPDVPVQDATFDTVAVLYGVQARRSLAVAWAAAGVGYSSGDARGRAVFTTGDRTWYRLHRYEAVTLRADAFAGIAGRALGIGLGAIVDINDVRQTAAWQVRLFYGAMPKYKGARP